MKLQKGHLQLKPGSFDGGGRGYLDCDKLQLNIEVTLLSVGEGVGGVSGATPTFLYLSNLGATTCSSLELDQRLSQELVSGQSTWQNRSVARIPRDQRLFCQAEAEQKQNDHELGLLTLL